MPSATNRVITDHEEIRRWAEERGGRPSCVKGTGGGGDVGMLRIDFPGYSGEQSLTEIGWDEWFDKFDERSLALIVQDTTARGQRSNFNKLVSRETAEETDHRRTARASGNKSSRATSARASRPTSTTRSRNRNRVEGRSSGRKTTARAGESSGRSSTRSASARGGSRTKSASTGRKQASSSRSKKVSRTSGRSTRKAA